MDCHERLFSRLLHIGGVSQFDQRRTGREWKGLLEAVERLAGQYAADPELGPLFSTIAKHERSWIESNRRRSAAEDDEE